ncbi:hypothetical protein SDC9_47613 [bioreactor metagenome]|uniref:Uncharacterized protein n=1 Tax=bioreactor metagenome TaxID=1076179 RepID=A0A644WFS6_9ZZZZ
MAGVADELLLFLKGFFQRLNHSVRNKPGEEEKHDDGAAAEEEGIAEQRRKAVVCDGVVHKNDKVPVTELRDEIEHMVFGTGAFPAVQNLFCQGGQILIRQARATLVLRVDSAVIIRKFNGIEHRQPIDLFSVFMAVVVALRTALAALAVCVAVFAHHPEVFVPDIMVTHQVNNGQRPGKNDNKDRHDGRYDLSFQFFKHRAPAVHIQGRVRT